MVLVVIVVMEGWKKEKKRKEKKRKEKKKKRKEKKRKKYVTLNILHVRMHI